MKMRNPKLPVKDRVYAGGSRNFDERTGRYQSPPIMRIPGLPSGPFTPGEGGMSPGQVPTGPIGRTGGSMPVDSTVRDMRFIDENQNGIDDRDEKPSRGDPKLQPIKQPPIRVPPQTGGPMPPPWIVTGKHGLVVVL